MQNTFSLKWPNVGVVLSICTYLALSQYSALSENSALRLAALFCLALAMTLPGLYRCSRLAYMSLAISSCVLGLAYWLAIDALLIRLPPLFILGLIASVFWTSLLPGREALVTAMGEKHRGPLSARMRAYTQGVTIFWAIFLLGQFALTLYFSIYGPEWVWALFTNAVNYLSVAMVFVAEYLIRRWRFPEHDHPSFIDYVKIVVSSNVRKQRAH